jgi:hypothetical protein
VTYLMGRIRRIVFGISPEEASFSRRGFSYRDARTRARLERVGATFLQGYHAALEARDGERLARQLDAFEPEFRGFAFEGAAMALTLLDLLRPWGGARLKSFAAGAGAAHEYMLYVGAGWAMARLRRDPSRARKSFDPLLGWLAADGYGFHEGYFKWPVYVARRERPRRLNGYAPRAFDQGLGRSLWFVKGAEVGSVIETVRAFAYERQSDLWSGVGLACAYAGGADDEGIEALRAGAGPFSLQLAQGAAFAAKARERAGNAAAHTERACRILCGMSAGAAAGITDAALIGLPADGDAPAYEVWRRRIADALGSTSERRDASAEVAVVIHAASVRRGARPNIKGVKERLA